MFDRFTAPARRAMQLAFREARRCQHDYLGTEHVLFGLLCDPDTGVHTLLRAANHPPDEILARLEDHLRDAEAHPPTAVEQLPVSPAAQRAFGYAAEEAGQLGRALVGPEHLLLSLMREPEQVAGTVLAEFGVQLDELRRQAALLPASEQRDFMVQPTAPPVVPAAAEPPARELESLVAPPITHEAIETADLVQRPGAIPAPAVNIEQPPHLARYAAEVETQLRRTQLVFGAVLGFGLGTALSGWEVGVLAAFGGMAVASVRNSATGALMGFLAGFILVPSFGAHLDGRAGYMKLIFGAVGAFLGSFLGDFWRRPLSRPADQYQHDDEEKEGT